MASLPLLVLGAQSSHNKLYAVGIVTTAFSLYLIRKFFAGARCHCTERLDGKTVIITGGSEGIGKETARALASKGARVILACSNIEKAKKVADHLKACTENSQITAIELNLASFKSVREFVRKFNTSENRLDILINNAGAFYLPRSITEDGQEITFQTNYLGHFMLTMLLIDKLKASAPSRIINVSSMAYKCCLSINFKDLTSTESFDQRRVYDQSKLALILFTRHLAERLQNAGVTVNALHPGVVDTAIFKSYPWLSNPFLKILNWVPVKICFKSPDEGAQTSIHCAVSHQCGKTTGCYFRDCAVEELLKHATDRKAANKLYLQSLQLTGLVTGENIRLGLHSSSTIDEKRYLLTT